MAKLIYRSNYFKNTPAKHKANFIKYLGTREGVELNPEMMPRFFFEDIDMHGRKENYMEYLAKRPGVEELENQAHGLFSSTDTPINLEQVMDEVANHPGIVWINVVSLKREDAQRLGYDNIHAWKNLLRRHIADMAENYNIDPADLAWYAAFHNEGHHPHVHLVIYSRGKEGYLKKNGIQKMKSALTRDVYRSELTMLYAEKTQSRATVKEQAEERFRASISKLSYSSETNPTIDAMLQELRERLLHIKGKKVYGYLHPNLKYMVDAIVEELAKDPLVKDCYENWFRLQAAIYGYYSDKPAKMIPLSKNPEFRSIKNMILREAMRCDSFVTSDKGLPKAEYDAEKAAKDEAAGDKAAVLSPSIRLLKSLEELFNGKIPQPRQKSGCGSDQKQTARERRKKVALGQKQDDEETSSMTIS